MDCLTVQNPPFFASLCDSGAGPRKLISFAGLIIGGLCQQRALESHCTARTGTNFPSFYWRYVSTQQSADLALHGQQWSASAIPSNKVQHWWAHGPSPQRFWTLTWSEGGTSSKVLISFIVPSVSAQGWVLLSVITNSLPLGVLFHSFQWNYHLQGSNSSH